MVSSSKTDDFKTIDMQQLADLAGVSRSTISRGLSDSPLVNEKTKQKIRELALKHNYVMNETARNLRLQKSNIICMVLMLDAVAEQHTSDPFFLEMIGSVADSLAIAGYDLLLYHEPIASADDFRSSRACRQSDGIIIIGQGRIHEELNLLAAFAPPIVVWGANVPGRKYRLVGSDNLQGGALATRHLMAQGCRRIAFFGDRELPELALRYEGYQQALGERGDSLDPSLELAVPFESHHANAVIEQFLDKKPKIEGIVCCSDLIAMSAIASLHRHGIRVPEDVAVVGYDDIDIASRTHPALTTISQDIRRAGELLVHKLTGAIKGKRMRDTISTATLVVRESSLHQG
ncbi:MAG: LacI family DNA-binding transcriptional regulator [Gammaproteobacteria bacterium]|nr:LacI family DNA-binding transcriptional regulator [Gammaproteobacteria bacterium]